MNREHHSGERRLLFSSKFVKEWEVGGWRNVQRDYRKESEFRDFVLLVSTVSDTSVEKFVLWPSRGFLFNIITDTFLPQPNSTQPKVV